MKFNSKEEADAELHKYLHWRGVVYDGNGKTIKIVFTGTHDKVLSNLICQGLIGNLPTISFNESDKQDADLWVGFHDCDIMKVEEMLQDEFMKGLLEPNGLRHEITITQEWSNPIRIPNGLSIRFYFIEDAQIELQIVDGDNYGIGVSKFIKRPKGGQFSISTADQKAFDLELKKRYLIIKMPDAHLISKDIVIVFEPS